MASEVAIERAAVIIAVVLLSGGVAAAWLSANLTRRVAGVAVACLGAVLGLAALQAGESLMLAGAVIALAQVALGAALLVRAQEAYGSVENVDLEEADARADAEARDS